MLYIYIYISQRKTPHFFQASIKHLQRLMMKLATKGKINSPKQKLSKLFSLTTV